MEKKEKTLYVSDLDGTLLNSKKKLPEFTVNTINSLAAQGMLFTYATARSFVTAREVTRRISPNIPVIVYNGAFLCDGVSGKVLSSNLFLQKECDDILSVLITHGIYPRVYALIEGKERFSYSPDHLSKGTRAYLASRRNDSRANPCDVNALGYGDVFCFSCIDDYGKLVAAYEILKERYQTLLYRDPYTAEYWLEVLPISVSKANAALTLKKMLGCDRLVTFGDEKNDLSMFSVSDASFAVENANEDAKHAATGVIGSNDDDGVAKWLLSAWECL